MKLNTERNSFYSIFRHCEQALPMHNIRTITRTKLNTLINELFTMIWRMRIAYCSKAETFRLFKTNNKFENYLDIKNRKHRVAFSKYRLSDHILNIEKGRHSRPSIPREERKCQFCPTKVEDEIHFLTECIYYKNREEFFATVTNTIPNFHSLNSQEKFIFLMTQENKELTLLLTELVYEWFATRRVQYKIVKRSLTEMQLTLLRISGNHKTIKQEQIRPLVIDSIQNNRQNIGLGMRIYRKPSPYEIISISSNNLVLKMTKKRPRFHPYKRKLVK